MSGRTLSRRLSEAELPCIPNAKHPQIERLPPQNEYEEKAEEYIKTRDDFEQMKRDTYIREYYLDLTDMEDAIREAEDYKLANENLKNEQAEGTSMAVLVRAADKLVEEKYARYAHGMACAPILRMLDENPAGIMAGLNRMLEYWATEIGDEVYEDFRVPEFRIVNGGRFRKPIRDLDRNLDEGALVTLNGTLLYLSDPPEVEFIKMKYKCVSCNGDFVSEERASECVYCTKETVEFLKDDPDSVSRNFQEAVLQEHIEDLAGSPATVSLRLYGSTINSLSTGERLEVTGFSTMRKLPKKQSYVYWIDVVSVTVEGDDRVEISAEDRKNITDFSKRPDPLTDLADMFAPEIIGFTSEKKAVILQAVGGVKKTYESFSVRGRIHVLLAGDPGKAKSQLLLATKTLLTKSLYLSDSSKAGLTAAISDIGNKRVLVPGILVLANGGLACIDELDKMQKEDREGLHSAMEQGFIAKSKAGLRGIFRAESSVLAAANPVYGRFDVDRDIPEQLKIESTLLDRFDLIFWIFEKKQSMEQDIRDALQVLRPRKNMDPAFLKKYIHIASRMPVETTEATERRIAEAFASLRSGTPGGVTIGKRSLHAIRRLAEASARVKLSPVVKDEDVEVAVSLLMESWRPLGFDLDRLSGTGSLIRRAIDFVSRFLKEAGSRCRTDELAKHAQVEKIGALELNEAIEKMKRNGLIFEPSHGELVLI